jgi:hypothetical protein
VVPRIGSSDTKWADCRSKVSCQQNCVDCLTHMVVVCLFVCFNLSQLEKNEESRLGGHSSSHAMVL